jgi:hypothetical protein
MDLIFADEGLGLVLQRIAGNSADSALGFYWKPFLNDVRPDRATILADLEFDDVAFVPVQLDSTDFDDPFVTSDTGYLEAEVVLFTNASGLPISVYGYAIVSSDGTALIASARSADAPSTIAPAGVFPVVPLLSNRSRLPVIPPV